MVNNSTLRRWFIIRLFHGLALIAENPVKYRVPQYFGKQSHFSINQNLIIN